MADIKKYPRTMGAGDTFTGSRLTTLTIITEAVISDSEGNVFGTYDAGTTFQGYMPNGTFVVTSGSVKIW